MMPAGLGSSRSQAARASGTGRTSASGLVMMACGTDWIKVAFLELAGRVSSRNRVVQRSSLLPSSLKENMPNDFRPTCRKWARDLSRKALKLHAMVVTFGNAVVRPQLTMGIGSDKAGTNQFKSGLSMIPKIPLTPQRLTSAAVATMSLQG